MIDDRIVFDTDKNNYKTSNNLNNILVPDEEDVTDSDGLGTLKFKNRIYNSLTPNGLGYKILRQGNGLTFASQITDTYTIYEIRYLFDLNSSIVSVPQGSILRFNGGLLCNGTLTGNFTTIEAYPGMQIFDGLTLSGTWSNINLYPTWFGADRGRSVSSNTPFQNAITSMKNSTIKDMVILPGAYKVGTMVLDFSCSITGPKTNTTTCGVALFGENDTTVFEIKSGNISISNLYILPNSETLANVTGILANPASNKSSIKIEDVVIDRYGSGIYTINIYLSRIKGCKFINCINGIEINNATSILIENCYGAECSGKVFFIGLNSRYCTLINCCNDSCNLGYYIYNSTGIIILNCAAERTSDFALSIYNSHVTIKGFWTWQASKAGTEGASLGYVSGSVLSISGIYEKELYPLSTYSRSFSGHNSSRIFVLDSSLFYQPNGFTQIIGQYYDLTISSIVQL